MGIGPLVAGVAVVGVAQLQPNFSYGWELLPALVLFSVGLVDDRRAAHGDGARRCR